MQYKTDIEIAQSCQMKPIFEIAQAAHIDEKYIDQYGRYKAKVNLSLLEDKKDQKNGKLVLVTAITPTPAGEGKTTTTTQQTLIVSDTLCFITTYLNQYICIYYYYY